MQSNCKTHIIRITNDWIYIVRISDNTIVLQTKIMREATNKLCSLLGFQVKK